VSEYEEIVETFGDYRAVIKLDTDAQEPYNDGATPIFRLEASNEWYRGYSAEAFNLQASPYLDAFRRFENSGNHLEIFERYLRIFHGTIKVQQWNVGIDREWGYLAFDTAAWREEVGAPLKSLEKEDYLSEVRSWAEGDVWGVGVEKRVRWSTDEEDYEDMDTWEETPDGFVWGYYGQQWAEEEARGMLEQYKK
jgi:hypothetical protein